MTLLPDNYEGPFCEDCSDDRDKIYFIPTFLFSEFKNQIVDGKAETVVTGISPAWICYKCLKMMPITIENAQYWNAFWFDTIAELSNVIVKTQFLESAPFGKR